MISFIKVFCQVDSIHKVSRSHHIFKLTKYKEYEMKGGPKVTNFQNQLFLHAQKLQKVWTLTRFRPKAVRKKYLLAAQKFYLNISSGSVVIKNFIQGRTMYTSTHTLERLTHLFPIHPSSTP